MRNFDTGATRNGGDKIEYDGFLSVEALRAFSCYMHKHRIQADGTVRDSNNWKKGIPRDVYMKSMFRHFMDVREMHDWGLDTIINSDWEEVDMLDCLCALMFNVQGYIHEQVKYLK